MASIINNHPDLKGDDDHSSRLPSFPRCVGFKTLIYTHNSLFFSKPKNGVLEGWFQNPSGSIPVVRPPQSLDPPPPPVRQQNVEI
jgi:hypothetical protein